MSELLDNSAQRVKALKEIIRHLHGGGAPDAVRERLKELVGHTDYAEVVAMEQELIAEGMPVKEIQSMCDLHSQIMRDVLVPLPPKLYTPGHPVDTFRRENAALGGVTLRIRVALKAIAELKADGDATEILLGWRQASNELMDVEKHYQRKENAIFSCLEKHGITGPPKVMWGKDDEVRQLIKDMNAALGVSGATVADWKVIAATAGAAALSAVEEMIYKEENILLPLCEKTFTDEDWGEIWLASPEYGWCLVEPQKGYEPPEAVRQAGLKLELSEKVQLPSGSLALDQLLGIFSALPVDLTFVDADDRVAFFSEGPDRVFARGRAILGRKVQHCHPPRSVDVVDRIIGDFRSGRQTVAEFWIEMHGKFVHIRYFAVKNDAGEYLGTLEVTQDVAKIRALQGERRLLEYDKA